MSAERAAGLVVGRWPQRIDIQFQVVLEEAAEALQPDHHRHAAGGEQFGPGEEVAAVHVGLRRRAGCAS
jgi:hypothetical protein